MCYRLLIVLLIAPFLLFTRLAGFYVTLNAVMFALYTLASVLCVGLACGLWWLGSAEEL